MGRVDEIWALGDHVGYGPDPSDVLAMLRERGVHLVAGNHDHAVGTGRGAESFPNASATHVARLHREWLSSEERDFLADLPLISQRGPATLFHGSLKDPLSEYVFDSNVAQATLVAATTMLCCHGHTHIPALFDLKDGRLSRIRPAAGTRHELQGRLLINPGSVGQPRDGDPRAAWAVLELPDACVTFYRTPYDVAKTQQRMRVRRLPERLVDRLATGE